LRRTYALESFSDDSAAWKLDIAPLSWLKAENSVVSLESACVRRLS
jgi:hypothetical protein